MAVTAKTRTRRRGPAVTSTVPVERHGCHVPNYLCPVEGIWTVDGRQYRLIVRLGQAAVDRALVRSIQARAAGEDDVALCCEFYDVEAREVRHDRSPDPPPA